MTLKPHAALGLAQWLAAEHPDIFNALKQRAAAQRSLRKAARIAGLGDDPIVDPNFSTFAPDVSTLPAVTMPDMAQVGLPDISMPAIDASSIPTDIPAVDTSSSSGGWLSSVGSGISNAVAGVGSFLTSTQGLTALTGLATQVFKTQQSQAAAQTQQAVLNAQVARAYTGQQPAPITYVRNPATGAVTPYLQSAQGSQPLTYPMLNTLTPSHTTTFMAKYGLWVGVGAIGLVALILLSRR